MVLTDTSKFSDGLPALAAKELQPGEEITWMESPVPFRRALAKLPVFVLGNVWTAFTVFWTLASMRNPVPAEGAAFAAVFPWFGLPFILMGVGLLASPWAAARAARRSVYVLTQRRAIIIGSAWHGGISVISFTPAQLTHPRLKPRRDGSGHLLFSRETRFDSDGIGHSTDIGFFDVRDVRDVERRVRALNPSV